jgi:hypothetical protein
MWDDDDDRGGGGGKKGKGRGGGRGGDDMWYDIFVLKGTLPLPIFHPETENNSMQKKRKKTNAWLNDAFCGDSNRAYAGFHTKMEHVFRLHDMRKKAEKSEVCNYVHSGHIYSQTHTNAHTFFSYIIENVSRRQERSDACMCIPHALICTFTVIHT